MKITHVASNFTAASRQYQNFEILVEESPKKEHKKMEFGRMNEFDDSGRVSRRFYIGESYSRKVGKLLDWLEWHVRQLRKKS